MAVVSNQSAIGRGLATTQQVEVTNGRVEELLGPIGGLFSAPTSPRIVASAESPAQGSSSKPRPMSGGCCACRVDSEFVIDAYRRLFHIEASFRMSKKRPASPTDLPPQTRLHRGAPEHRVRRACGQPPHREPNRLEHKEVRPHRPPLPHHTNPLRHTNPHRRRPPTPRRTQPPRAHQLNASAN
jgi:hypothetical protein